MDDLIPGGLDPADDHAIRRYVSTLQAFTPSPGFVERVLARVWRPVPRWLRQLRERVLPPHRIRAGVAVLAAGAFLWQAALAVLIATFPDRATSGLARLTSDAWPWLVETGRDYLARGFDLVTPTITTLLPSGTVVAALSGAALTVMTVSTWGLYRLAGPARSAKGVRHAVR